MSQHQRKQCQVQGGKHLPDQGGLLCAWHCLAGYNLATWIEGFLHQSLAQAVTLELNLSHEPTAVARKILTAPGQSEMPVEDVREVFEAYGRTLLILGDPGSGKTITLLQLAETLIAEAQHDPSQPIPVVLNLASWAQAQKPLTEWLVEEIFIQYQVARQLTRQWIGQNLWLYLLDGLDEVAEDVRDDCVAAINAFKAEHPAEMVVCSRVGDYEKLKEKLNLGTAVRLQSLTDGQIQTYLSQDEASLSAVREAITTDADLNKLAHTPLFLTMMTLAYGGDSLEQMDTFDSMAAKYNYLFATYVDEMFRRRPLPEKSRYTQDQARHWLTNLAYGMKQHNQIAFFIEQLQPTWLPTHSYRYYKWAVSSLTLFPYVLSLFLLSASMVQTSGIVNVLTSAKSFLMLVFLGAMLAVLFEIRTNGFEKVRSVEVVHRTALPREQFAKILRETIIFGVLAGVLTGITYGSFLGLASSWVYGLYAGLLSALTGGKPSRLALFFPAENLTDRVFPNQGIHNSLKNGFEVGVTYGVIVLIVSIISINVVLASGSGLFFSLMFAIHFAVFLGLRFGGEGFIDHFTLRHSLTLNNILPNSIKDGRLIAYLDDMVDHILLRRVGGVGSSSTGRYWNILPNNMRIE